VRDLLVLANLTSHEQDIVASSLYGDDSNGVLRDDYSNRIFILKNVPTNSVQKTTHSILIGPW
jgi:hypothetical protein